MTHSLHVLLFAHQPFFIPDDEIRWRTYSTYFPVLDAFIERGQPVTLVFTGGLLRRVACLVPEFIVALRHAVASGVASVGGSAAYHPLLPTLTTDSARWQIEDDKRIRHQCGLPDSSLFWPTELAWSHRVALLAHAAGYRQVVVDSRACDLADTLPLWEKRESGLIPVQRDAGRFYRSNVLRLPVSEREIEIWRRDSKLAHRFVHMMRSDSAEVGRVMDEFGAAIVDSKSRLMDPLAPALLGEDMERFLPNGLARFLDLLDAMPSSEIELISADVFRASSVAQPLNYIPAGTLEGGDGMWNSSVDDRWFREQLARVSLRAESRLSGLPPTSDERDLWRRRLLEVQDSGFHFWPYISRTRRPFYEQLSAIEQWLDQTMGDQPS